MMGDVLNRTLSDKDSMFAGDMGHYIGVGCSAMTVMRFVVDLRPGLQVRRVLDMACGYGRVLRHMRAAWPDATLHACDIDPEAVAFCAQEFGATPVLSTNPVADLTLPGDYDVIWVGSLITHLHEDHARDLLRILTDALSETGLCLLSFHGSLVSQRLSAGRHGDYGLSATAAREVLKALDDRGYGYRDYQGWADYGVSCIRPDWFLNAAETEGWHPFFFAETAWDQHHDVIGCCRKAACDTDRRKG